MIAKLYYYFLMRNKPWLSQEKIKKIQFKKLKRILDHAYKTVPFYRELYKTNNISQNEIKTFSDLFKLPVISREDIKGLSYEKWISLRYQNKKLLKNSTGGSSGKPWTIYYTNKFGAIRVASMMRAFKVNGYKFKQKIVCYKNKPPKRKLINKLGYFDREWISINLPFNEQLKIYEKIRPDIIEGHPSSISQFARYCSTHNKKINIKQIITNSETLTPSMKRNIIDAFGITPIRFYDSWEFGVMAWDCPKYDGLHINQDLLHLEILNNDKPAKIGDAGDIAITDFHNYAAPLIRYKIGDIGVLQNKKCSCGIQFLQLKDIAGRVGDLFTYEDNREINIVMPLNDVMRDKLEVIEYQAIQKKKRRT